MNGKANREKNTVGLLLAGGRSSRFGSDKALADFGGRPLIAHVAAGLETVFERCLLATGAAERYGFLGLPMVRDQFPGCGPLAGIHAGLLAAAPATSIFVAACDMPHLTPEFIRFLLARAAAEKNWQVILPGHARGVEPLCALYHRSCLEHIEACLARNELRLQTVLAGLRTVRLKEDELRRVLPDLGIFRNVNTPADFSEIAAENDRKER